MRKLTPEQVADLKTFAEGMIEDLQKSERNRGIGYFIWRRLNRRDYRDIQRSRAQRLTLAMTIRDTLRNVEGGHLGQPVSPQGH